ncbi:MAG: HD domain-containing protein [Candidatus Absconditabacteria bacterium]
MFHKVREIKHGLDKIRSGRKNRGIAEDIAETIWQHTRKVAKAAAIYGKHFPDIDLNKLVKMAKYHDIAEYKEKDYVPGEISEEEKHQREKKVMLELKDELGSKGDEVFDFWMEFEKGETKEAQINKQLDKLDAAIQAMEYEKLGYKNVTNFYDYALSKLTDPILIKILNILLKKEYPDIDTYKQYFLLLEYNGDEDIFKEKIKIL